MGSQKPKLVRNFLVERGWASVVLSDVDTTWLRNPEPYLALHPTADVFISTDCLSHKVLLRLLSGESKCLLRAQRLLCMLLAYYRENH